MCNVRRGTELIHRRGPANVDERSWKKIVALKLHDATVIAIDTLRSSGVLRRQGHGARPLQACSKRYIILLPIGQPYPVYASLELPICFVDTEKCSKGAQVRLSTFVFMY